MIYLLTGANGAGKTLFGLKWCQELATKDARPVCYNGRFERVPGGPLENWKLIDFKNWQDEPDGTIFFIDECHNDLPNRKAGDKVPDYVQMLAEHRRRGFDFFLITQHPQNIDVFVRRLIGTPGYHRHLKRTFGAALVSCLEWAAVNATCEKADSGKTGQVKMLPFPKEVFTWYRSAELHTGKTRIPRQVYVIAACVLLVPLLGYFAVKAFTGRAADRQAEIAALAKSQNPGGAVGSPGAISRSGGPIAGLRGASQLSASEYLHARTPRIEGLPHTAPAFDAATQVAAVPYPAACIDGIRPATKKHECSCYTQQGTKLQTPETICVQIAANGFFIEWSQGEAKYAQKPVLARSVTEPDAPGVVVPLALPVPKSPALPVPDKQTGGRVATRS